MTDQMTDARAWTVVATLRAMAQNYTREPARHTFDHLDATACNEAADHLAARLRTLSEQHDVLTWIMRAAEDAKEACAADPESPEAIRNSKFAAIAGAAAQALGLVKGPSYAAPSEPAGDVSDFIRALCELDPGDPDIPSKTLILNIEDVRGVAEQYVRPALSEQQGEAAGFLDDDFADSLGRNASTTMWRDVKMARGNGVAVYARPQPDIKAAQDAAIARVGAELASEQQGEASFPPCPRCRGRGCVDEGDPEIGSALFDCEDCDGTGLFTTPVGATISDLANDRTLTLDAARRLLRDIAFAIKHGLYTHSQPVAGDAVRALYDTAAKGFHVSETCGPEKKYLHVSKFRTMEDLHAYRDAWIRVMVEARDAALSAAPAPVVPEGWEEFIRDCAANRNDVHITAVRSARAIRLLAAIAQRERLVYGRAFHCVDCL